MLGLLASAALCMLASLPQDRPRLRDAGIEIGVLPPGPHNAITDVAGVRVGHATVVAGEDVRTGVTVILPHGGNPFAEKVPAAIAVANGFGKLIGFTQVEELGTLESPIALTSTLNVALVADALIGHLLELPGNESVRSVNVVVGETNDGRLNDVRGRHVRAEHVRAALAAAHDGVVEEGSVGAGTGTVCFGWKGGIGTASRAAGGHLVGVLVQTNFGGALTIAGVPVHRHLAPPALQRAPGDVRDDPEEGSCMIVVATDAPLDAAALARLARRAFAGMARTGASFAHGSGDYAIAFSTAPALRTGPAVRAQAATALGGDALTPLFAAVAEATEEAILNSLFRATPVESRSARAAALPVDEVKKLVSGR